MSWDQEVMMPSRGGPFRAGQMSTLAALQHQRMTDPRLGELMEDLSQHPLDTWDKASVREMKRSCTKAVKLPESLVRELARTRSEAYQVWVQARKDSDFPSFAPWLKKMFQLKRQEARCLAENGVLYDALLDDYEPAMTSARLDEVFSQLRPRLSNLLQRIQDSSFQPDRRLLRGDFPVEKQKEFGVRILSAMGFDWEAGRLDVSPHPFCVSLSPGDVRITSRYSDTELGKALFGMIHECGHALYEQGLDSGRYGQPAAEPISLGMHESQSRLWENVVARSRPFWTHWLPLLREAFPGSLAGADLDSFIPAVNLVEASLIRVEADEVTYGLHVILRYEIEKALVEGRMEVEELEQAWNGKMEEYLGIRPPNAAEGALQDTHWSQGLIGYFPTYLLGNIYGAPLWRQANRDLPALQDQLAGGEMLPLREWL
ncbi:MAG: carboxypeptidase M32, partial [Acidobacteriota bacterium]